MNILAINPFSSAEFLFNSLKTYNFTIYALYTYDYENLMSYIKPKPELFDKQIFVNSYKIDDILNAIKDYQIDYIINGSEGSVHIFDSLAQIVTPQFANDPKTSETRMNKYEMHNMLATKNINHIKQMKIQFGQDDLNESKFKDLSYPCFVKPLFGAASCGAAKINSHSELCSFFANLDYNSLIDTIKTASPAIINLEYLICEYVEGEEYLIDSFSYNGNHAISTIQHYVKRYVNGNPIYRYAEIDNNIEFNEIISVYLKDVLNAIGFMNGFAHTEVFIDKFNKKPILIEVNPRISGAHGMINQIMMLENLPSQPDLLAQMLLKRNIESFNSDTLNKIKHFPKWLTLFNFQNKPLPDFKNILKKNKSCIKVVQLKPPGFIWQNPPKSLVDAVAFVVCRNTDTVQLNQDINQILSCDENGWDK